MAEQARRVAELRRARYGYLLALHLLLLCAAGRSPVSGHHKAFFPLRERRERRETATWRWPLSFYLYSIRRREPCKSMRMVTYSVVPPSGAGLSSGIGRVGWG